MKTILILAFVFLSCLELKAQELVFIQTKTGKTIKARIGDQLAVTYMGYRNQVEYFSHDIFAITDSSVFLGTDSRYLHPSLREKFEKNGPGYKEILLKDLIKFRRISIGRKLLKQTLKLGTAIGTFYLVSDMIENNNLKKGQQFLISLGIGLGVNYFINLALPENPKYEVSNGWIVTVTK